MPEAKQLKLPFTSSTEDDKPQISTSRQKDLEDGYWLSTNVQKIIPHKLMIMTS